MKVERRFHSLELTDLHLLSHHPALSRSGKKREMNVKDLKAMVEVGERLMACLRRGRSWDAGMLAGKNNDGDTKQVPQRDVTT